MRTYRTAVRSSPVPLSFASRVFFKQAPAVRIERWNSFFDAYCTCTIASADNVDFVQSNAAVYSGSQHHSCHTTSIQLLQLMPQMAIYNDSALTTSMNSEREVSPITSTSVPLPTSQTLKPREGLTLLNNSMSFFLDSRLNVVVLLHILSE